MGLTTDFRVLDIPYNSFASFAYVLKKFFDFNVFASLFFNPIYRIKIVSDLPEYLLYIIQDFFFQGFIMYCKIL